MEGVYHKPRYYHAAFPDAGRCEIDIIKHYAPHKSSAEPISVLEAACGTGRILEALANKGFDVVGYDLSDAMVAFAADRLAGKGLGASARVLQGDMTSIKFDQQFDLAFTAINSIRYLLTDQQYLDHFRNTADALKPGGVYIFHLGTAHDTAPIPGDACWEIDHDGIRGMVCWESAGSDPETMTCQEYFEIDADDNGERIAFRDYHTLRLMYHEDLRRLIADSGRFTLEAVYREDFTPVDINLRITGEMDNHFYVLRLTH